MAPNIEGRRLGELCGLIGEAFDADELRQHLRFEMDVSFADIAAPARLPVQVFDLVGWAQAQGRLAELVRVLSRNRPYRRDLKAFADSLTGPGDEPLECAICPHRPPAPPNRPPRAGRRVMVTDDGVAGGWERAIEAEPDVPVAEVTEPAAPSSKPPKPPPPGPDPDDPQSGRWVPAGQKDKRNERDGRKLSGRLVESYRDVFLFDLVVSATDDTTLVGPVVFHMHPTYPRSSYHIRKVRGGKEAVLEEVQAWGTYTVGAQVRKARRGWTALEYDLDDLPDLPKRFLPQ